MIEDGVSRFAVDSSNVGATAARLRALLRGVGLRRPIGAAARVCVRPISSVVALSLEATVVLDRELLASRSASPLDSDAKSTACLSREW